MPGTDHRSFEEWNIQGRFCQSVSATKSTAGTIGNAIGNTKG